MRHPVDAQGVKYEARVVVISETGRHTACAEGRIDGAAAEPSGERERSNVAAWVRADERIHTVVDVAMIHRVGPPVTRRGQRFRLTVGPVRGVHGEPAGI